MVDIDKQLKHYGGQALIEGVLMRGKNNVVAAMRDPKGEIHVEHGELTGIYKSRIAQLPMLRGLVILWDSLALGMKYLTISANLQTDEGEKIEGPSLYITLFISVALSVGIFFVIPSLIVEFFKQFYELHPITINLIEGLIRLSMLVLYIWGIGFSKDISRVFAYHGAEHKTINAYENGVLISAEKVKNFPLAHPRCGTSFMLTLVIISIIVFSLLGELSLIMRIVSRILLVPFIAMFAYEIIRLLGDHLDNPLVKIITGPNLMLQRLTTREPSKDMIEVAIRSFNILLDLEEKPS